MLRRIIGVVLTAAVLGAILCPSNAAAAAKKKGPKIVVRFHLLADKTDSEKFAIQMEMLGTGKQVYVSRSPALSELDIVSCYPFQASDGSWGCAFYLSNHGRLVLDALSIERRGSYVVAMIGARHVSDLLIDQRISDGIITIPNGLTKAEIDLLVAELGVYGAASKKSQRT